MGTAGMRLQQQLAILSIIHTYRQEKFAWGKYDCHTFIADCHDAMFNTNTAEEFKGKYSTHRDAIRYYKNSEDYTVWLKRQGYEQKQDTAPKTGDIITVSSKYYVRGSIFVDGCISMTEWGHLGMTPYFSDPLAGNKIWRYKWEQ